MAKYPMGTHTWQVDKAELDPATAKDWGSVDKTKLPGNAFAWVQDPENKSTWKLPHHFGAGAIDKETGMYTEVGSPSRNGVRAALQAIQGSRTGQPMNVPAEVRQHLERHARDLGLTGYKNTETKSEYEKKRIVKDIEIFKAGTTNDGRKVTAEMVEQVYVNTIKAMESGHIIRVQEGHRPTTERVGGRIIKIYKKDNSIYADMELFEDTYQAVKEGRLLGRSVSLFAYVLPSGAKLDSVIEHLALLGTSVPAIDNLRGKFANMYFLFENKKDKEAFMNDVLTQYENLYQDFQKMKFEKINLEKEKAELEAQIQEYENKIKQAEVKEFENHIDKMIQEGRILPKQKEAVKELFETFQKAGLDTKAIYEKIDTLYPAGARIKTEETQFMSKEKEAGEINFLRVWGVDYQNNENKKEA